MTPEPEEGPAEGTPVFRYRTEIVVPSDRYVWIKLPDRAPEGRALVSVIFSGEPPAPDDPDLSAPSPEHPAALDPDREDIEWWDEFDEDDLRD